MGDLVEVDVYSVDTESDVELDISDDAEQFTAPQPSILTREPFRPPHAGAWHASYSDCSVLSCGWHLKTNIGKQHWGCCYKVSRYAWCDVLGPLEQPPIPPPRPSPFHSVVGDVPRYVVHLDAPIRFRWRQIIEDYKDMLPLMLAVIEDVAGVSLASVATGAFSLFTHLGVVYYGDELRAIAKQTGISVGKLALMQVAYEAFAFCTSIVVDTSATDPSQPPMHIRTMDWEMPMLQRMTIEIEYRIKNKPVFLSTSWPGYIGCLTGMRLAQAGNPDTGYGVSINYRRTGTSLADVAKNFMLGAVRSWPIGYLIRKVLTDTASYSVALEQLANSDLMAPVYIIISGSRASQGALLTRDRGGDVHRKYLTPTDPVVQTNMDHFRDDDEYDEQNICHSVPRRQLAGQFFESLGERRTFDDLWQLCNLEPIYASDNIYTVSMSAGIGEYTSVVQRR